MLDAPNHWVMWPASNQDLSWTVGLSESTKHPELSSEPNIIVIAMFSDLKHNIVSESIFLISSDNFNNLI